MGKFGAVGLAVLGLSGLGAVGSARAADAEPVQYSRPSLNCRTPDAPYKNYDCLDKYLGDGFFERMVNYYRLEWGHEGPPADPKAPPSRRAGWGRTRRRPLRRCPLPSGPMAAPPIWA